MPTNRHAIIRYQVIDGCLQQRNRKWTAAALAEACADALAELDGDAAVPSRSTIGRDIRTMRLPRPLGYDAPILWNPREGTYRYTEPGYTITRGPLREEDLRVLDGALAILRQFRHFGQVEGLEALAERLRHSLRDARRQGRPIVQFSTPPQAPSYQWLDTLYQAVESEQCLLLDYEPFRDPPFRAVISPYLLKEYNGRWFLIGRHHALNRLYTFALDRIKEARPSQLQPFRSMPEFDPDTYFNDVIGVTIMDGRQVEDICFRATPLRARYLLTKPVHHSLRVLREGADFVDFSLRLIPNYELESWLLSFADEVQLLQPQWLVEKLRQRLERAAERYGP